jgi:hypothetical protein
VLNIPPFSPINVKKNLEDDVWKMIEMSIYEHDHLHTLFRPLLLFIISKFVVGFNWFDATFKLNKKISSFFFNAKIK